MQVIWIEIVVPCSICPFLYIPTNQSRSTGRQTNKYKPDVKYQWSCDSQVDTCVIIKVLVTKCQKKRSWNNKEKMLRATMDGNRLIGKVNPRHRVCYLPHNGKEVMTVKMTMMMVMIPAVSQFPFLDHGSWCFVQAPVSSYSALALRPSTSSTESPVRTK